MHPATRNRTLIRLGAIVCLLPLFALPFLMRSFVPVNNSPVQFDLWGQVWTAATSGSLPLIAVLLIGGCLALFAFYRRGFAAASSVAVILAVTTVSGWAASSYSEQSAGFRLGVPEGTKVWCNGILLGQGPIQMTNEEFDAKVQAWETPPKQHYVVLNPQPPGLRSDHRWRRLKWEWIPSDPRRDYFGRHWPPFPEYPELMSVMRAESYWWRFEKDGYVAMDGKYLGFHNPFGRRNRVDVDLQPNYPARERHIQALSELIQRTPFEPNEQFRAHIRKFGIEDEIDVVLAAKKKTEPADVDSTPVHFENEAEAEEVFGRAVDHIHEIHRVESPSYESDQLLRIGRDFPQVIRRRLAAAIKSTNASTLLVEGGGIGHSAGFGVDYDRDWFEHMLVISVASACGIVDDSLFNELVLNQQWSLLVLSDRPEVAELVRSHLEDRYRTHNDVRYMTSELRVIMRSGQPEIQEIVRGYAQKADSSSSYFVRDFVLRQIELGTDPVELSEWVSQCPAIERDLRAGLLAKIAPADFSEHMDRLKPDLSSQERWLFKNAADPVLDWLMTESLKSRDRFYMTTLIDNAENPRVRDFVKHQLQEGRDGVYRVNNALHGGLGAEFEWLQDEVIRLLNMELVPEHRDALGGFLDDFSSDEAYKALVNFAAAYPKLQRLVDNIDRQRREKDLESLALVRQAKALIAGEIAPEDLLGGDTYVWKDAGYEKVLGE